MGRVYGIVEVNGTRLNTLFDSGALRSYIIRSSVQEANLRIDLLKNTFQTGLGGEKVTINECCLLQGKIEEHPFYITANIISSLGRDEKGEIIDLLFGAPDMQVWNIQLDIEKERLDLSRFRKEFIEF